MSRDFCHQNIDCYVYQEFQNVDRELILFKVNPIHTPFRNKNEDGYEMLSEIHSQLWIIWIVH